MPETLGSKNKPTVFSQMTLGQMTSSQMTLSQKTITPTEAYTETSTGSKSILQETTPTSS